MGTYEASVECSFRASHGLTLPDGTREPSHSHLWRVTAEFRSGSLDAMGVVIDFVEVQKAMSELAEGLQGADLNELRAFSDGRPSAERLAEWFAGALVGKLSSGGDLLHRLAVTEAPGCSAAYYPDRG